MAKNRRFNRNRHNRQHKHDPPHRHNPQHGHNQPQKQQGPPRAPQPHQPQPQHRIVKENKVVSSPATRSQVVEAPRRAARESSTAGMTREEKYASLFIIAAFLAAMYFLLF